MVWRRGERMEHEIEEGDREIVEYGMEERRERVKHEIEWIER